MTAQLIVFETSPLHAQALAGVTSLELREVRSLFQLRPAIRAAPTSVVAVELHEPNLVKVLETIIWAKTEFSPTVIGLTNDRSHPYALEIHESGVDFIFRSNLDLPQAGSLIRQHLGRLPPTVLEELPFRSQIWQRLPWKRHDTGGRSRAEKRNNG